jgi:hypothetical protein
MKQLMAKKILQRVWMMESAKNNSYFTFRQTKEPFNTSRHSAKTLWKYNKSTRARKCFQKILFCLAKIEEDSIQQLLYSDKKKLRL